MSYDGPDRRRHTDDSRDDVLFGLVREARDAALENKTTLNAHIMPTLTKHIEDDDSMFGDHNKRIRVLEKFAWVGTGSVAIISGGGVWFLKKIGVL